MYNLHLFPRSKPYVRLSSHTAFHRKILRLEAFAPNSFILLYTLLYIVTIGY
nr:MAG TPA: hypothetical protein [Caudoviricetes sp.]DAW52288.1 MAG TPA: hypothetical protein [Caudoviricetes sp.]